MSHAGFQAGSDRPSRTSILVAASRAFGSHESDSTVRNPDWMAERIIGPAELDLIRDHPIVDALKEDYDQARQRIEVAGSSNLMLIRTRFIDECLERAVRDGIRQLVILGAGFDTRAYRFETLLKEIRIIEVDSESTQKVKKQRVIAILGSLPTHVTYAAIDFKQQDLIDVLRTAGYDPAQKTFFVWEGVSMYLSEETVRRTLNLLAGHSAAGSSLVMDYAGRAFVDILEKQPNHPQHMYTTGWGEPWVFGVPDRGDEKFFAECGFQTRQVLGCFGPAVSKKYLTRKDGTRLDRGGRGSLKMFVRMLPMILTLIMHKSRGYALAELVVPDPTTKPL